MTEERLARIENHVMRIMTDQAAMTATTNAHVEQQKGYNDKVCKMLDKHEKRLDSLDNTRRTLFGIALGTGGISGASIASFLKFWQ